MSKFCTFWRRVQKVELLEKSCQDGLVSWHIWRSVGLEFFNMEKSWHEVV